MEFNNKAIENIFMGALTMTHSKCDGCGESFPIGKTTRYAWVFYVCNSCLVECRADRMSFRVEEAETYEESARCSSCERLMAPSKFRTINGVEECIFRVWPTCAPCIKEHNDFIQSDEGGWNNY